MILFENTDCAIVHINISCFNPKFKIINLHTLNKIKNGSGSNFYYCSILNLKTQWYFFAQQNFSKFCVMWFRKAGPDQLKWTLPLFDQSNRTMQISPILRNPGWNPIISLCNSFTKKQGTYILSRIRADTLSAKYA